VDHDNLHGHWEHGFSQLSAQFELSGLTSLLHLERMSLDVLIGMTSLEELVAQRLLQFVCEDIGELQANKSPRPKRMGYSN
jgi:hypothetical protein